MIKVDLITGFLGSGKTTFLKKYAAYLIRQNLRIGILENDFGAVNVDMLLLQDLRGENCELEMVAGGCDAVTHARRFKTKLISMAMSGYDRIVIEPSGLFDMDEFFDVLRDDPLENWYEIGNVIVIMDPTENSIPSTVSADMDYQQFLLSSQLAYAGCILPSKLSLASQDQLAQSKQFLQSLSEQLHCRRPLDTLAIWKDWDLLDDADWNQIVHSGYQITDYIKRYTLSDADVSTLYFLETGLDKASLIEKLPRLFGEKECGEILRVKGFCPAEDGWWEVNATSSSTTSSFLSKGQEVIIVIGMHLHKAHIEEVLGVAAAT